MELVVASNNKGKIKEYKEILEPLGFEVFSQSEKNINIEVEETGETFEENSYLKAKTIYDITKSYVISDDSGLRVHTLNNEPGLYSARYKGLETEHERRMAILDGLKDSSDRSADFVCCICFIDENGGSHTFMGVWDGEIAYEEKGEEGFGYDPIFIAKESNGKTTAENGLAFKEKYSHRAIATRMLINYLKENKLS